MDKQNKDIEKEIDNLEKLIEQVKQQQELEKKNHKKNGKKPENNVIRIDLGSRYSSSFSINMIVSFLINFLLMYFINAVFNLFELTSIYTLLIFSMAYTLFEETYKHFLLKRFLTIVLYSYGMIFFFINIVFIYVMDLFIFPSALTFLNEMYPLFFVLILQVIRIFIKNIYVRSVQKISMKIAKIKIRK